VIRAANEERISFMPVNSALHYLLSGLYLDSEGVQQAAKRADLSPEVNEALQLYSEEHISFSGGAIHRGFCNEPTYRLNNADVSVVAWRECFTEQELEEIEKFCVLRKLQLFP
jgi:hypothetical protein